MYYCKVMITILMLLLPLLSFTLARPQPHDDHLKHQMINKDAVVMEIIAEELETEVQETSCEGKAEGLEKQECLMMSRRTLINNAHEDYIYTCGDCPPQNLRP